MTYRKLLHLIDITKIKAAIEKAERLSSSEICVSVSPLLLGNVQKAAEKTFNRLGMTKTKERNGVLFFVMPSRRKIVIIGDCAIYEKVGQEFWQTLVNEIAMRFRKGDFTDGLVQGIEKVTEQLIAYFPC